MRHFAALGAADRDRLFHRAPQPFDADSPGPVLAMGLGATLYSPATRPCLADDIEQATRRGVISTVVCLEDAIPDESVPAALQHTIEQLGLLADRRRPRPAVFVRVRDPEQVGQIALGLSDRSAALTGFVLPKFSSRDGAEFLGSVFEAGRGLGRSLWAMPVIETPAVMHTESRREELLGIYRVLDEHREQVLAVRVGATDLASVFGLRRPPELTVYDVRPVADAIGDIVNVMGRADGSGFVVTGPVWEYFTSDERIFKPQLRVTPFSRLRNRGLRTDLISDELDGLIREVLLDRANGLTGKTVIHPSHVHVVHCLSVVSHEEYDDATSIVADGGSPTHRGGVTASSYRNKMNEANPHRAWAALTLRRAEVFGVAAPGISFVDLMSACVHA